MVAFLGLRMLAYQPRLRKRCFHCSLTPLSWHVPNSSFQFYPFLANLLHLLTALVLRPAHPGRLLAERQRTGDVALQNGLRAVFFVPFRTCATRKQPQQQWKMPCALGSIRARLGSWRGFDTRFHWFRWDWLRLAEPSLAAVILALVSIWNSCRSSICVNALLQELSERLTSLFAHVLVWFFQSLRLFLMQLSDCCAGNWETVPVIA